jgi:aminoglycoside phosphotransferase family enzyme
MTRARQVIETHMSRVVLTDRHAFKVKKPVLLAYVDYRTAEQRRASCEKELRLGRRLAATVYEKVTRVHDEPMVVMRRLPADRMLPAMLARRAATRADADAVGDLLADFYARSPSVAWGGGAYVQRILRLVRTDGAEVVARGGPRDAAAHVLAAIEQGAFALAARARHVVDAHGDLRPEHVCLETPPVIIDPLEIDELRLLDPASELAFFVMECERLGAAWFAERVLVRYSTRTGDVPPPAVLELYGAQHALTRGLIALRRLDDVGPADRARWRAKAADYLARAS